MEADGGKEGEEDTAVRRCRLAATAEGDGERSGGFLTRVLGAGAGGDEGAAEGDGGGGCQAARDAGAAPCAALGRLRR